MYPDFSYILHDLAGTNPDNWASVFKTFGMFLVLAILTAAWFFYQELKRKAEVGIYQSTLVKEVIGAPATAGELVSNGFLGFLLGFKGFYAFQHLAEFQADAAGVLLSGKGHWPAGIALGLIFAGLQWWEKKRKMLPKPKEQTKFIYPHDRIGNLTVIAAISGIIGAKVFSILEEPSGFLTDPVGVFFSGSGLAIYGGLIGGFLGVKWYLDKHKIPFWHTADAVAPALIIAYGVGRIGCHLSGDGDWGIEAGPQPSWWFLPDWLWAYDYPMNVNREGIPIENCPWKYCYRLAAGVYPTSVYETIAAFIIGGFLWAIRKKLKVPGILFFIYLILNGFERFWIEKIRVNVKYDFLPFQPTQAEIIAILLFLTGIAGVIWLQKKQRDLPEKG